MRDPAFLLFAFASLVSAALCRDLQAESLPTPPFVVNCGPQAASARVALAEAAEQRALDPARLLYLPDIRSRASRPFGHHGGEGYRHWHGGSRPALGPGWESDVFGSGRLACERYAFVVPEGMYHVAIGISEGDLHAEGQRVFDVLVNDRVVARDLDPIANAGYKEPIMIGTRARVSGPRPLTVSFRSKTKHPAIVSAIWVWPWSANDSERVSPPQQVRCVGSYGANLISWHRPRNAGIDGFVLRRGFQEEDFAILTPQPVYTHRWMDRDVQPGETYFYQVGTVLERGTVRWSKTFAATPLPMEASTLPVYAIDLPPGARGRLLQQIHAEHSERGKLTFRGKTYPVELRLRGASTRHAAKKSYRIRFLETSPLPRKVTYLKGEPMDHTMQQEKLSCDLFRAVGASVSAADYVNLMINDEYQGVYLDMEPVRAPFKKNEGLDPAGTLIRASTFQHHFAEGVLGDLRGDVGGLDELERFVEHVNHTPRGMMAPFVRQSMDWPRVMDYLALIVLTHRTEIEADDYFFYRSSDSGRWSFIPWDHNNGNFHVQSYGNRIGEPAIDVFPQTIQQLGWEPSYWYVLPSRIFHVPALRAEYLSRLESLTHRWLTSGKLGTMVEQNYQRLRSEYPMDPHRWPYTDVDPFMTSATDLKAFIERHAEQILRQIERERNRRPASLVINEFSFGSRGGWVELHNRGSQPASLDRVQLVTKDRAGNWRLPLRAKMSLRPGEYHLIEVPFRPIAIPPFTDEEARERWEIERRESPGEEAFPGFSPNGGFVGLVRWDGPRGDDDDRVIEEDDRERDDLLDFFFYGPLPPGRSYGRTTTGFGFQTPTPNGP